MEDSGSNPLNPLLINNLYLISFYEKEARRRILNIHLNTVNTNYNPNLKVYIMIVMIICSILMLMLVSVMMYLSYKDLKQNQ
jgi:hypothetical protein